MLKKKNVWPLLHSLFLKGEEEGLGRKETKHKDVLNICSEKQEKDP